MVVADFCNEQTGLAWPDVPAGKGEGSIPRPGDCYAPAVWVGQGNNVDALIEFGFNTCRIVGDPRRGEVTVDDQSYWLVEIWLRFT